MKNIRMILLLVLITGYPVWPSSPTQAGASLELYGTFHAMGVTVSLTDAADPNKNTVANVEYRTGGEPYRAGFPLSHISNTRFVGSLFWLEPGTTYDVRITLRDPDNDPLDGVILQDAASTRAEMAIPPANNTFVVAPDGEGATCSLSAPCSLTEAIGHARPGDEVVLRGGVYYQGEISLPRSGAPGAPIVIRGYNDENAVLDGAEPSSLVWSLVGGGIYHTTARAPDVNLVTANGVRLYPYPDLASLENWVGTFPVLTAMG